MSPLNENTLKSLRKESKKIKEGKNRSFISMLLRDIRKGITSTSSDSKDTTKDDDTKKNNFTQQQTSDLDKKVEEEIFSIKIRALVTSPNANRPEKIIEDLARSFSQYNYIELNSFKFKKAKDIQKFAKDFINRLFRGNNGRWHNIRKWDKKMILSIKEVSSIIHIPNAKFNRNPRISRQKFKIIPAPDNIPTEGILLGYNTYAGIKKEIRIRTDNDDRFRHMYII